MHDDHTSTKAKQYFTTIKLLRTFQKHYGAAPRDLGEMRAHWTRAFRGFEPAAAAESSSSRRFSRDTEQALNRNWDKLEAYVAGLQRDLKELSAEIEGEAREAWRDVSIR